MPQIFVRVDAWSLAPDDPLFVWYERAVAAMQAKARNDPTSWSYQAAMHGTYTTPTQPLWNQCKHGSWWFISWHRTYLYYFERIVRAQIVALGGPESWALPYWNYDGGSNHNEIPTPFRSPTKADGSPNALYTPDRGAGINTGLGLDALVTSPAAALACPIFVGNTEFGGDVTTTLAQRSSNTGVLEATPHNAVHGAMGGLMGYVETAAEDPIFWLHHCNIDRLWWIWTQSHVNTADARWTSQSFDFFDAGGAAASLTSADVEDIVTQLQYTYDHQVFIIRRPPMWPPPGWEHPMHWPPPWSEVRRKVVPDRGPGPDPTPGYSRQLIGATEQSLRLVGGPERVSIAIDERVMRSIQEEPATEHQGRVFLDAEDIEAEHNPGVVYGVFVNAPENPSRDELTADHVGNLSFFGVERALQPRADEHGHGLRIAMELTQVLDRQAADGSWSDGRQIEVTLLPIPLVAPPDRPELVDDVPRLDHEDMPVTIGRLSLHFA